MKHSGSPYYIALQGKRTHVVTTNVSIFKNIFLDWTWLQKPTKNKQYIFKAQRQFLLIAYTTMKNRSNNLTKVTERGKQTRERASGVKFSPTRRMTATAKATTRDQTSKWCFHVPRWPGRRYGNEVHKHFGNGVGSARPCEILEFPCKHART